MRRNARQEASTFRGAGPRRRARKIRRTVGSLIWCPSLRSSPWNLWYPQAGFSCASRSMRSRISSLVRGRPGRFGYVHQPAEDPNRDQMRAVEGTQTAILP